MLSYLCQSNIGKFLPVKFYLKLILGILSKNQNWDYRSANFKWIWFYMNSGYFAKFLDKS